LSLEKHYKKLIKIFLRLEIFEVQEGKGQGEKQLLEEAVRVKKAFGGYQRRVLLDPAGKQSKSEDFARWLGQRLGAGEHIAFAIGSSHGFHGSIKTDMTEHISLSSMTFPHDLCRIIFLEQLYRALNILNSGLYHK